MGVIFLLILFYILNQFIFNFYKKKHSFFERKKMDLLYLYHLLFFGIFLWYSFNNPADSKRYYEDMEYFEGTWLELLGTDTLFINFVSYPFYRLGFSYSMLMLTFAWFGYLGFVYAYVFMSEKIPVKVKVFKRLDLLTLILFFPNMHFWTSALGKDSLIFMGLMMFTYAIINPKSRIFLLILSSLVVFYIRPHVFMFVAVGVVIGYLSGKEKIPFWKKATISLGMVLVLTLVMDDVLNVMGLGESENIVEDFQSESGERSKSLSTSGSGVDMSNYPLPFKFFTFWFRPLFIDAPNILGIITSFENLIYLLLFFKILKKDFIKFLRRSPSLIKMSFVIFILSSFALTFVMSNLGIIMRQKSMVMYFIFFVIYYYLAQKKYRRYLKYKAYKLRQKKEAAVRGQISPT
ncbi:hypothetical protein [Salinimicrobium sp. HB62]|uniref:hypothetical protein n=1 Tax=Salinimicrobium sp. HB62 TaxID=3077781 RepID=UPI002D79D15B|nr:hypothetical protein [Salinimicrobium sp. HB62]